MIAKVPSFFLQEINFHYMLTICTGYELGIYDIDVEILLAISSMWAGSGWTQQRL